MEEYGKMNDAGKFKWTYKGRWELAESILTVVLGIILYGKAETMPIIVIKVISFGFIVIGFLALIDLAKFKWKTEVSYYKKDKLKKDKRCPNCKCKTK